MATKFTSTFLVIISILLVVGCGGDGDDITKDKIAPVDEGSQLDELIAVIGSSFDESSIEEFTGVTTFDIDGDGEDDKWTYNFYREEIEEDLFDETVIDFESGESGIDTTITITLENAGNKTYKDYEYIFEIPKSFAESVDDLEFSVPPDMIIESDPIVGFYLDFSPNASEEIVVKTVTPAAKGGKSDWDRVIDPRLTDLAKTQCAKGKWRACAGYAIGWNAPSLCEQCGDTTTGLFGFRSLGTRDLCYWQVARNSIDPSLCAKIGTGSFRYTPEQIHQLRTACERSCLAIMALASTGTPSAGSGGAGGAGVTVVTTGATSGTPSYSWGDKCGPNKECDWGECQFVNGEWRCIHCGYWGERCCEGLATRSECEPDSECVNGYCYHESTDCGHTGYRACDYDDGPFCYSGVYNSQTGFCEACGDYEQPCCQNTNPKYACDYGKCINGICKKVTITGTPTAAATGTPTATIVPTSTPTSSPTPTPIEELCESCDGVQIPEGAKRINEGKLDYCVANGVEVGAYRQWFDEARTQPYKEWCYDEEGRWHGFWTTWYTGGVHKESTVTFDHGVENGPFFSWWENGEIREEGNHKDGEIHGIYKSYRKDATPVNLIEYENGKETGYKIEYGSDGKECTIWDGTIDKDGNFTGTITKKCKSPETGIWVETYENGKYVDGVWH